MLEVLRFHECVVQEYGSKAKLSKLSKLLKQGSLFGNISNEMDPEI